MDQARLKLFQQFKEEEPEDPFNWYALALEVSKQNSTKALELFEHVLKNHPAYLPAYYHAADVYLSLGNSVRATEILNQGIALAQQTGEQKTMRELKSLLDGSSN